MKRSSEPWRRFHLPWPSLFLALVALVALRVRADPAKPVVVSVSATQPGASIPSKALGVSYETRQMLPDANGVHYFRPDNQPLINTFRTLGIENLRVGGNSVDDPKIAIPTESDVASLFDFAKAAGVKVIYSVRLEDGDPASAAKFAKLIGDRYADALDCFAIGNEPNYYPNYDTYRGKWTAIRDAMVEAYPGATFCGPDQNPSRQLNKKMVRDFGNDAGKLVRISQHSYPLGCAYKNYKEKDPNKLIPIDAADAREKMLAPSVYPVYEKIHDQVSSAVQGTPLGYRLTETSSYWFSGLKGASDTYASALWSVEYLYWWVSHGAEGLNFHTGDMTGGAISLPCRYAVFVSSPRGYEMRPLAYGLKLFDLGGHGNLLPVSLSSDADSGLVAYATLDDQKFVSVTLINKSHGAGATSSDVQIKLDAPLANSDVKEILLTEQNSDIAAGATGVTLGGAAIGEDGSWKGSWSGVQSSDVSDGVIIVSIPPASAIVVRAKIR